MISTHEKTHEDWRKNMSINLKVKRALCMVLVIMMVALLIPDMASAAPSKLAAPTDVKWITSEQDFNEKNGFWGTAYPGWIQWKYNGEYTGDFTVKLYDSKGKVVDTTYWWEGNSKMEHFVIDVFRIGDNPTGKYRFSVQAVDEKDQSRNSKEVMSEWWSYTRPSTTLSKPTNFSATAGSIKWNLVKNADAYQTDYYFAETKDGEQQSLGYMWGADSSGNALDFHLNQIGEWGPGYYFCRVRALSNNILKYNNSPWTTFAAINFTGKGEEIVPQIYSNLTIKYRSEANKNKDLSYSGFTYKDQWLLDSAYTYDHEFATMSLAMAMTGFESVTAGEKDKNIKELYGNMGFDVANTYESWGYGKQDDNSVAYAIATKQVNGETLMAVTLRGGGYGDGGWAGNFEVSNKAYHQGFDRAANSTLAKLKSYYQKYNIDESKVHIWLTGYSRSAATANALSVKIMNEGLCKGENLHTYTFATPNTVKYNKSNSKYKNIFNIINPADIVPRVPLYGWDYGRYGNTYSLPAIGVIDDTTKNKFLETVPKLTNGANYLGYIRQDLVVQNLTNVFGVIIPSTDRYVEKYQRPLMLFKRGENGIIVLLDLFLGGKNIAESIIKCDNPIEMALLPAKLEFYIGIELIRGRTEVTALLKILKAMAVEAVAENVAGLFEDDVEAVNYKSLLLIADMLDYLINDKATSSRLLREHWPETYMSWMLNTTGNNLKVTNQYKTAYVKCPVDVEVVDKVDKVDKEGKVVARTTTTNFEYTYTDETGNKVTTNTNISIVDKSIAVDGIEAYVIGEEKMFILPEDGEYSFRIITNENYEPGDTMTVTVESFDEDGQQEVVEYKDIALDEELTFDLTVEEKLEDTAMEKNMEGEQKETLTATTIRAASIHDPFYDAQITVTSGNYNISGKLDKNSGNVKLIFAAYDKFGRYLSGTALNKDGSTEVQNIVAEFRTGKKVDTVKVMIVDSTTFAPKCKPIYLIN